MIEPVDGTTPGELTRWLARIETGLTMLRTEVGDEIRGLRAEVVRRDVYDAHRISEDIRIRAVEGAVSRLETLIARRDADRGADRRLAVGAALAAGGSMIVSIVTRLVGG